MKHEFTLEGIAKLDNGRVAKQIEAMMARMVSDCFARPFDKNARRLNIEIGFVPVLSDTPGAAELEKVDAEFSITGKVPTHRSPTYSLGVNKNNQLWFREDSLDDAAQRTFDDERAESEKKKGE